MKGLTLTRFVVIVNLSLTAACTCAASPQEQAESAVSQSAAVIAGPSTEEQITTTRAADRVWMTTGNKDRVFAGDGFLDDQRQIWTSPRKLRLSDAEWFLPLASITTGMILTDASFSRSLSSKPSTLKTYEHLRTGSVAALAAASGAFYLWSFRSHDPHHRETGLLATEAILDSLAVTQGIKFAAGRERPLQGNGQGKFFHGGASFSSGHSAAAWAAAGILAHEYHGPMTKLLAYGLATTVSVASVGSRQHFPSDVVIGSGLGWAISEYVYRKHHDPELGGGSWDPLKTILHKRESGPTRYPGSVYVPVDSWIYGAFDRLAALGYVPTAFQGKRPWSRAQCARLLADAEEALASSGGAHPRISTQAGALVQELRREFARESRAFSEGNVHVQVDSLYTRVVSASGTVLNDGYHFGQTYAYDFGRPFRQGTNFISGTSASATLGNLFFFFRGEYQHSPSAPGISAAEGEFIANRDKVPLPSDAPFAPINQFRLLDAYAGINLHGWQISFGDQSLSWGPGIGGSLLLSNNAAPLTMLRVSPQSSVDVPGLSRLLGPFSWEQFYGRLEGHQGISQPWIYGQKISFKPLRSLEFAYGRTTLIGGSGHPLNSRLFLSSLLGRVDPAENSVPGDSRSAVEWTWRLPGLHDWVTFYGELENDDDVIPLENPSRSVLRPGIYLPRLPFLPKLDLHFEWTSSTTPGRLPFQNHGDLNYWNFDYKDGYTNNGNLMANTVGREGVTLQAWCRYWISPRHNLDFSWKQSRVLADFVPGGGKWQDFQASYSVTRRSGVYLKSSLQLEHISSFPVLFPGSRTNVTTSVELGFLPQWARARFRPAPSAKTGETQPVGSSIE
jgi:membrane-associated phospholipid phosphatase